MVSRKKVVLASRPSGIPREDNLTIVSDETPELKDGEILVKNAGLAIDPVTRTLLDEVEGYRAPLSVGDTIPGMVVGVVQESRNPKYKPGTVIGAYTAWETHSVLDETNFALQTMDVLPGIPLVSYLGGLGWSGVTAYVGLKGLGRVEKGDSVVISAAAGSVGSMAGQLAKYMGCHVVGLAGSDDKIAFCKKIGFDSVINYKTTSDLSAAIAKECPNGANVYFDNVGGTILDTMLPLMADHGRIVVCGMVSDYNQSGQPTPVHNLWQMVVHRITMRGFLAFEHPELVNEGRKLLNELARSGQIILTENVSHGLEQAPAAFVRLMSGQTVGKTVVSLAD